MVYRCALGEYEDVGPRPMFGINVCVVFEDPPHAFAFPNFRGYLDYREDMVD